MAIEPGLFRPDCVTKIAQAVLIHSPWTYLDTGRFQKTFWILRQSFEDLSMLYRWLFKIEAPQVFLLTSIVWVCHLKKIHIFFFTHFYLFAFLLIQFKVTVFLFYLFFKSKKVVNVNKNNYFLRVPLNVPIYKHHMCFCSNEFNTICFSRHHKVYLK